MRVRKFLAGAATSAVAVSVLALTGSPAFAANSTDPQPDDTNQTTPPTADMLVGGGSDTTQQLRAEVLAAAASADAVVMAAAPADFRPVSVSEAKIKKADDGSAPALELVQNPDILHELSTHRARSGSVVVGFAAETGDGSGSVLDLARAKLARKGCDLLVVNDVSGGAVFGSPDNEGVILGSDGSVVEVPRGTKTAVAHAIWDEVAQRLQD